MRIEPIPCLHVHTSNSNRHHPATIIVHKHTSGIANAQFQTETEKPPRSVKPSILHNYY